MRISDWSSDVCSSDLEANAAHEFHKHPKHLKLASDGILLPHWDKAQLQRGMQVYREVCSACDSLNLVAFRDIQDLGYTEGQVKTFAKGFQVASIKDRKSVVKGKSVSVRVDPGGRRFLKKKIQQQTTTHINEYE